jgi:RNA polymerase sigma factor (sigma-70 family)
MLNNCYKKQQKFSFSHEKPNEISDKSIPMFTSQYSHPTETVQNRELSSVIENSLRQLPVDYRVVFVLREINGFSVKETASILDITETNVKVRLNRARTMLRKGIEQSYKPGDIFEFNLIYCDMIVSNVMQKLQAIPTKPQRSQNEYD